MDNLIGSSMVRKKDLNLNTETLDRLTTGFVDLATSKNKALYLAILNHSKAYKQYGDKIVREMKSKDRMVYKRHISIHLTKLRLDILDKGFFDFVESLISDILLYDGDSKDFQILVNLVGETHGKSMADRILANPNVRLS